MKTISILLCCILLLNSCQQVGTVIRSPKQLPIAAIHTGTQGIDMRFVEQAPPLEVMAGNRFEIAIDMENKGAVDTEGIIAFGIPVELIASETPLTNTFRLYGKKPFMPIGQQERFSLLALAGKIGEERFPTLVSAQLCYTYKTETAQLLCIKPETATTQRKGKDICTPNPVALGGGQGAPVAVTHIEKPTLVPLGTKTNQTVKPSIQFHIQNLGTGIVVDKTRYGDLCEQNKETKDLINQIHVSAKLSNKPLTCKLPKTTDLSLGVVVTCTEEEGPTTGFAQTLPAYEALLEIKLEYGYVQQRTKNFVIKNPS